MARHFAWLGQRSGSRNLATRTHLPAESILSIHPSSQPLPTYAMTPFRPARTLFSVLLLSSLPAAQSGLGGFTCSGAVDLNDWTPESYAAVSGFGAGAWDVTPDGSSVTQTVNGQPTLFYSDFEIGDTALEGRIRVSGSDDDLIGFVLGFQPGDSMNPDADYLLVDWKRGTQPFNFGAPSCSDGTTSDAGLAVSRVTGIPTADEFWGHTNTDDACSDLASGLQELQRGLTLGSTGWSLNTDYDFRFEFGPTRLRVFVNGTLELDIVGSFDLGRMGFYNFSQAGVTYSAFSQGALAAWSLYGNGTPGPLGLPQLTLSARPVLGTQVQGTIVNSTDTDSLGCFLVGVAPVGMLFQGFELLVAPTMEVPFVSPANDGMAPDSTTITWNVPGDAALCGAVMYAQAILFDPVSGLSSSRGLRAQLGQ